MLRYKKTLLYACLLFAGGRSVQAGMNMTVLKPHYTMTVLTMGNNVGVFGLSDTGQLAGEETISPTAFRLFVWQNGMRHDVEGVPTTSKMIGANGKGQIFLRSSSGRLVVYEDGQPRDGGSLLSKTDYLNASRINNKGQIAGYNGIHALLWQDDVLQRLPSLEGFDLSEAVGLNDQGQTVGFCKVIHYGSRYGYAHAALWQDGKVTDLGEGVASAINNKGQIVGTGGPGLFLWENHKRRSLGTLPGFTGYQPAAINDRTQIVGRTTGGDKGQRAFLWQEGVMYDLNDLVEGKRDWTIEWARAINNQGQILVAGLRNGQEVSALLTPQ